MTRDAWIVIVLALGMCSGACSSDSPTRPTPPVTVQVPVTLTYDVEYFSSAPAILVEPRANNVGIGIGQFVLNGQFGGSNLCSNSWVPPTNRWICRGVVFDTKVDYYIKVGDVYRSRVTPEWINYGRDIYVDGVLLTRVGPYASGATGEAAR